MRGISSKQNIFKRLPLGEAKECGSEQSRNVVEDEVAEKNPNVSPPRLVTDVKRLEVLISNRVLAILACSCSGSIHKVSSNRADKVSSPLLASLPGWRVEGRQFVISAANDQATVKRSIRIRTSRRRRQNTHCNSVDNIADNVRV